MFLAVFFGISPLLSVESSSSLTNSETGEGLPAQRRGQDQQMNWRWSFHQGRSFVPHNQSTRTFQSREDRQSMVRERTGHGSFSKLSDSGPLDVTKVALYLHRKPLARAGTDSMDQSDGIYNTYTPVAWGITITYPSSPYSYMHELVSAINSCHLIIIYMIYPLFFQISSEDQSTMWHTW